MVELESTLVPTLSNRVQIKFSKLYHEKLYDNNLLTLALSEGPLRLNLKVRKFCNYACCKWLENVLSNVN